MARSNLARRVRVIEDQRNQEFCKQFTNALTPIGTHPVDLALQICMLQPLDASSAPEKMPRAIKKLKEVYDRHLESMNEEDRNHVLQIVDEYQTAADSGGNAISAVTDKHTEDSKHE